MVGRSILLGASAGEMTTRLVEALERCDIHSEVVANGPQVMERALFERYDAVVLDTSMALLDPRQLRDLLKTNPRTRSLPIHMLDLESRVPDDPVYLRRAVDDLSWIGPLMPGDQSPSAGVVTADLGEIQLPDMLQMLLQNRRSGVVQIESRGRLGLIEVAEGQFGRIQLESHEGLKALARMLAWETGSFRFQPREEVEPAAGTDAIGLLLDAVRLADEAVKLRERVPPGSRLAFQAAGKGAPRESLHEEILMLIDFYGAVDDILERVPEPDAMVLEAILALQEGGWVEIRLPRDVADTSQFADIEVRADLRNVEHPIVWVVGQAADIPRILWNDARLQQRLIARRSIRNSGRFGGHGWIVDLGDQRAWLRFVPASPLLSAVADRPGFVHAGAIMVFSEIDGDDVNALVTVAGELEKLGAHPVWLPLDQQTGVDEASVWIDEAGRELPGTVLHPSDDLPQQFWQALRAAAGEAGEW